MSTSGSPPVEPPPRGARRPAWVPVRDIADRMGMSIPVFADAYLDLSQAPRRDDVAPMVTTIDGVVCVDASALDLGPVERDVEMSDAMRSLIDAFTFWIKARGLTGEWETFRDDRVPLVCARRGGPQGWRRRAIDMHNVVVRLTWMPEILWSLETARRSFLADAAPSAATTQPLKIQLHDATDLARAEAVLAHVPTSVDRVRGLAGIANFLTPIRTVTPLMAEISQYADDRRGQRKVSHSPVDAYVLGGVFAPTLIAALQDGDPELIVEVNGDE